MDSVSQFRIQGFIFCDDCKQYEPLSDSVADSMGASACVCCGCNRVRNSGKTDFEGRAL